MSNLSRGIRNHNPGNIRLSNPPTPWQGVNKACSDKSFVCFQSPVWGVRALMRTLIAYQDKHDLRSIEAIINRWAPSAENDTESYIKSVEKHTRFSRKKILDMHDFKDNLAVVKAIILHENGSQPYDDAIFSQAGALAGLVRDNKVVLVKDEEKESKKQTLAAKTIFAAGFAGTVDHLSQFASMTATIRSIVQNISFTVFLLTVIILIFLHYKTIKEFIDAKLAKRGD